MSGEDFKNKKEDEALKFLEKNFISSNDGEFEAIKKPDLSYLDSAPSNEYMNIPLEILPCGMFYKSGTRITIRAAKVQEVQAYSVVDDNNYLDITEKMNQLLSSCVKYFYANGMQGSYKDLRDGDRLFIIFMVRELTFPGGKNLFKDVTCDSCHNDFKMELRATNSNKVSKSFVNYDMPEKLKKFFDEKERIFNFVIDGVDYKLAPPTIGIQEIFFGDIKTKVQGDKSPNVAFLKLASFLLHDRNKITEEGIKVKEQEFKRLDMKTFQILNQAVNQMLFGIKEMKNNCPSCGVEVRTDMSFPAGASSLFTFSDAIEEYFG